MSPSQVKRFQKLCKDMACLLKELHDGDHPDAVYFIEDGSPMIVDWPNDIDRRPSDTIMAHGCTLHKAGGGGR